MPYNPFVFRPDPNEDLAKPEGTAEEATEQKPEEAVRKEGGPDAEITPPGKASEIESRG